MAFCAKCGAELIDGALFCHQCGNKITDPFYTDETRRQEFVGVIYKCPNCGQVLESFETHCPACGMELREAKSSNAIKEFAHELEAIEEQKKSEKPKWGKKFEFESKYNKQKVNLIQNFNVPNTKEDIIEFMILATTNTDISALSNTSNTFEKEITKAWIAKANQVYAKAQISFGHDKDFLQITNLYNNYLKDVKKGKRKEKINQIGLFLGPPLFLVATIFLVFLLVSSGLKKENKRLEEIEQNAVEALDNREYSSALIYADALEFNLSDSNEDSKRAKRQWEIKREVLIDKIINQAAKEGIDLERP